MSPRSQVGERRRRLAGLRSSILGRFCRRHAATAGGGAGQLAVSRVRGFIRRSTSIAELVVHFQVRSGRPCRRGRVRDAHGPSTNAASASFVIFIGSPPALTADEGFATRHGDESSLGRPAVVGCPGLWTSGILEPFKNVTSSRFLSSVRID